MRKNTLLFGIVSFIFVMSLVFVFAGCGGDDSCPGGQCNVLNPAASPTPSLSPSTSPIPSGSPSTSPTPSGSPSASPTPTCSPSASPTPTCSPSASPTPTCSPSASPEPTCSPSASLAPCPVCNNWFFLHGEIGDDLVMDGNVIPLINAWNDQHGCCIQFWSHGTNEEGLINPQGQSAGTNYAIPGRELTVENLAYLFTSMNDDAVQARAYIMNYCVIILLPEPADICGEHHDGPPRTNGGDHECCRRLEEFKEDYLAMRNFFDLHPDKLFILLTPPPKHRFAVDCDEARKERELAVWLKSTEYLGGHPNIVVFDLFDYLANQNDVLRYEYEKSHIFPSNEPNAYAWEVIGPIFTQFVIDAARSY